MKTLRTMTVGEVRDLLADYDDSMKVVFAADYGDHSHTMQALAVGSADLGHVTETAYSNSGFAVLDEDSDEAFGHDGEAFVVLASGRRL